MKTIIKIGLASLFVLFVYLPKQSEAFDSPIFEDNRNPQLTVCYTLEYLIGYSNDCINGEGSCADNTCPDGIESPY